MMKREVGKETAEQNSTFWGNKPFSIYQVVYTWIAAKIGQQKA